MNKRRVAPAPQPQTELRHNEAAPPRPRPPAREAKDSKRPKNSAFKQQRLRACQPIISAGTVLPVFFAIGVLFIPLGVGLWFFPHKVTEATISYTDCQSVENSTTTCGQQLLADTSNVCHCVVHFTLHTKLDEPVYMYYALTKVYQNHRKYVKSKDNFQLWGDLSGEPSDSCKPLDYDKLPGHDKKKIYPCGAIANSMFSDEITLTYLHNGVQKEVGLIRRGIAWDSDKEYKFKNPPDISQHSSMWNHFTKPPAWRKNLWELDPENPDNNGVQNEDFIIWMRTATLPNFRKLYRIIKTGESAETLFQGGLPVGNYTLNINYAYEVMSFKGTKSIILSTTSPLGSKNPFVSYIIGGTGVFVLLIAFLFVYINYISTREKMRIVEV